MCAAKGRRHDRHHVIGLGIGLMRGQHRDMFVDHVAKAGSAGQVDQRRRPAAARRPRPAGNFIDRTGIIENAGAFSRQPRGQFLLASG